jgi:hypothetical protein
MGRLSSELARYMGRIAARFDGRVSGNDGVYNRPAGTASLLRNAITVQHEADVYRDSISRRRMSPAR